MTDTHWQVRLAILPKMVATEDAEGKVIWGNLSHSVGTLTVSVSAMTRAEAQDFARAKGNCIVDPIHFKTFPMEIMVAERYDG